MHSICSCILPVQSNSLVYKKATGVKGIPSCGLKSDLWKSKEIMVALGNGQLLFPREWWALWWCVSSGYRLCLLQYFGSCSLGDLDTANYFHSVVKAKVKVIWDCIREPPPCQCHQIHVHCLQEQPMVVGKYLPSHCTDSPPHYSEIKTNLNRRSLLHWEAPVEWNGGWAEFLWTTSSYRSLIKIMSLDQNLILI